MKYREQWEVNLARQNKNKKKIRIIIIYSGTIQTQYINMKIKARLAILIYVGGGNVGDVGSPV